MKRKFSRLALMTTAMATLVALLEMASVTLDVVAVSGESMRDKLNDRSKHSALPDAMTSLSNEMYRSIYLDDDIPINVRIPGQEINDDGTAAPNTVFHADILTGYQIMKADKAGEKFLVKIAGIGSFDNSVHTETYLLDRQVTLMVIRREHENEIVFTKHLWPLTPQGQAQIKNEVAQMK